MRTELSFTSVSQKLLNMLKLNLTALIKVGGNWGKKTNIFFSMPYKSGILSLMILVLDSRSKEPKAISL